MDWLSGINNVAEYIEENLTEEIEYSSLAKIVGCSVYEFSRIFSFMAGISVSEYIRRRRLSQAVFDIQNSNEKILDIALKYCYESQAAFTRAFKEVHGHPPALARKNGVSLKTYPKITFKLTIKGVNEMNFRIERTDSFKIIGLKGNSAEGMMDGKRCDLMWPNFMGNCNRRLFDNGGKNNYYRAPFWQVAAYSYGTNEEIIGAKLGDKPVLEKMDVSTIPAAIWAVFTITSASGFDAAGEAYTRIETEWFPSSQYRRDESVPNLEVYPGGDADSNEYQWEIWMPVKNK